MFELDKNKRKGIPSLNIVFLILSQWKFVLPDALHSVRSLLCTATNATPHERFLSFNRRSTSGVSIPNWLLSKGPVLLKKHTLLSKYDPLVEEVELLYCNPHYTYIRYPNGKEDTVSVKHLAPRGEFDQERKDSSELPDYVTQNNKRKEIEMHTDKHISDFAMCNVPNAPQSEAEQQIYHSPEVLSTAGHLIKYQQRLHPYNLRNREV